MDQQTPTTTSRTPVNIINIRPPLRLPQPPPPSQTPKPPPLTWLERTWKVTHSTLPIWKTAKNVTITYKILHPSNINEQYRLEDIVTYDHINNTPETKLSKWLNLRRICGVDYPIGDSIPRISGDVDYLEEGEKYIYQKWQWRGNGWLKITGGSKWEILGWGEYKSDEDNGIEYWVVTYFEASFFSPAGLDVMVSGMGGISKGLERGVLEGIGRVGGGVGCEEIGVLGEGIFEVGVDL